MLGSTGNISYSTYLVPIDSSGTVHIYKWEKNKPFKNELPNL